MYTDVYRSARHGIIFFLMYRDTPNTYTSVSLYQIAEKHSMYDLITENNNSH